MLSGIDEYLGKARSVTCYDIANRFNIRMSVARKLLREKEANGELIGGSDIVEEMYNSGELRQMIDSIEK